ncbi:hypothetical protein MVEN_02170000 [Mycena venus]|uniref:Uncharacterized protein n=1 Tax=Mycena venus TaxID=2733690 RepID=A0A8H7CHJ8_9AGAR|nr:hypothetical protein MVEN_02170000 [Mycena venus]
MTLSSKPSLQIQTGTSERSSRSVRPRIGHYDTPTAETPQSHRRPRRKSPPSMFGVFDTTPPKPPKPLLKLDKKSKSESSSTLPPAPPPRQRHATLGILGGTLRGTKRAQPPASQSSPFSVPDRDQSGQPSYHPVPQPADIDIPEAVSSLGQLEGTSYEDEYLVDDLNCGSKSRTPSPIQFAAPSRPPSLPPKDESFARACIPGSRPNTPSFVALNSQILGRSVGTGSKERWIGEWNQEDIQQVISKLRLLK